ncbi:hypothetical protein DSO57_1005420 [Entomophthora muscae]|uniref:Uncharacterized protein n=1 Tax=Entomophthora muscae TaxID=34485 RepID=A0ACC2TVE2_9FUNG|nr:hypothetical protein DSO57_1005420 [Entomophthora muscae]
MASEIFQDQTRTISLPSAKPPRALKNQPLHPCFQEAYKDKVFYSIYSTPSTPSPSSSTSPSPKNSSPNKSDEANSKPTKECCTKKAKAAKEPTSSSGKKKEASKQASKNPSPPDGSYPLPHLIPKMSLRSTPRSSKLLESSNRPVAQLRYCILILLVIKTFKTPLKRAHASLLGL